ncbi:MAG: c-type cytochrome [Alphaproteobacteria bacterium]
MRKLVSAFAAAVIMSVVSIGYANAADVKMGKKVFNKCKACHTLVANKHRIGPSLHGIFGRTAGTAEKYKFSKAMKKSGADGLVWTEETLAKYLVKPRAFVKGTKMIFAGIKKPTDMENLIAFLKEAAQ